MTQKQIILFDGVCNFCNSAVNFVIRRDKKQVISFAPLQTDGGKKIVAQHNGLTSDFTSFIFVDNGRPYTKSTAALRVCKYLDGLWPLCYVFIVVPLFLRDHLYDWIAKNRYKWFGKKDICMIPTPELRARFLN